MSIADEKFGKYKDETGEDLYCPIGAVTDSRVVSERERDDCVEAATAGRYSGNLDVVDRFTS